MSLHVQSKQNLSTQSISIKSNDINETSQNTKNAKKWNLNDPLYIFSNAMNEYMPGLIVKIHDTTKEFTVRYWDVQSLDIKHKKRKLYGSNRVKLREYNTKHDPWNLPFSDTALCNDHIQQIKQCLFKKEGYIDINIDIDEWFIRFKIFLTKKNTLHVKNPFIRLISSYLGQNAESWIAIFTKYIYTMRLFEQESNNEQHLNAKLEILFNILNVGSQCIDGEALHIICLMYAKGLINENESETREQKRKIAKFAKKLVQKIKKRDDEIDIDEFKHMVGNTKEMNNIISQSINDFIIEEKPKMTII